MLVRCKKCGRPVYARRIHSYSECPYCYEANYVPDSAGEALYELLDWREPLYQTITIPLQEEDHLLISLLGHYRDTGSLVEKNRHYHQQIRQEIIEALEKNISQRKCEDYLATLKAYNDDTDQDLIIRLKEAKNASIVHDIEIRLNVLFARISDPIPPPAWKLQEYNNEIRSLLDKPIWHELGLENDRDRINRNLLNIEEQEKAKEEEAKKQQKALLKKRKCLKIHIAFIIVACLLIPILVSSFFVQHHLEKARQGREKQSYRETEQSYQNAIKWSWLNGQARSEATQELTQLRLKYADALMKEGSFQSIYEANELLAVIDDDTITKPWYAKLAYAWYEYDPLEEHNPNPENHSILYDILQCTDGNSLLSEHIPSISFYEVCGNRYLEMDRPIDAVQCYVLMEDGKDKIRNILEANLFLAESSAQIVFNTVEEYSSEHWFPKIKDYMKELGKTSNSMNKQARIILQSCIDDYSRFETAILLSCMVREGFNAKVIWPDGIPIHDFGYYEPKTQITLGDIDRSKPLVLTRTEKPYEAISDTKQRTGVYSTQRNEEKHDVRSLNDFDVIFDTKRWTSTKSESRLQSLTECTCILLIHHVFEPVEGLNSLGMPAQNSTYMPVTRFQLISWPSMQSVELVRIIQQEEQTASSVIQWNEELDLSEQPQDASEEQLVNILYEWLLQGKKL